MSVMTRDDTFSAAKHDKIHAAVIQLVEALREAEKVPKEARIREIVVSHPGGDDAMVAYRISVEE